MKVANIEDYQGASPTLSCFAELAGHDVQVFSEPMRDEATIASRTARRSTRSTPSRQASRSA